MKKVIESELVSIAHRILKLKDKSEVHTLYFETQKLYEKLSVLKFYEDNKFRLDASLTEEKFIDVFNSEEPETDIDEKPVAVNEGMEDLENQREQHVLKEAGVEAVVEQLESSESLPDYMSAEIVKELLEDAESKDSFGDDYVFIEENEKNNEDVTSDTSLELNLSETASDPLEEVIYTEPTLEIDPIFQVSFDQVLFEEKSKTIENTTDHTEAEIDKKEVMSENRNMENQHLLSSEITEKADVPFHKIPLNKTINDAFSKTISIGLNDRIAFEKNLFNNSSEDLNRVISQLNTIENFQEAEDFIEDLVKPDFQYWQGKEEYAQRFMELVKKRFL